MPSGIYLPPWLQPVDRIGPFMQGVSQGVNMARTALAAQAQAFQAQQEQQELALHQQQEERAVATAVAGVIAEKEKQKQQQQLIDLKAQSAAQQFSAQLEYEQSVQGGEDPATALMRIGPRMGINPAAMAGRMIGTMPPESGQVVDQGGEKFIRTVDRFGQEHFQHIPSPTKSTVARKTFEQQAREKNLDDLIRAKNSEIRAAAANVFGPEDKSGQALMTKLESERDSLMEQRAALYAPEQVTNPVEQSVRSQLESITPKPTETKVRRKSDSKLFTYKGNRSDIPLDKFEILE